MLLIYTSNITPRISYIVDFISRELFDVPVTLTSIRSDFENVAAGETCRLNYSDENFNTDCFIIRPVPLLFETTITVQYPEVMSFGNSKALYPVAGDFDFDIFAASFYLLSRYEEYLPHTKDEYGRYAHLNSIAFRENFLQLPVINIWLDAFRLSLQKKFPLIVFRRCQFQCNITYDVDIAYSYRYKGFLRTVAGFLRSLVKGDITGMEDRWLVLRGKKQDPFDCFEWLDALHLYCRLKPYYFFLVAKKQVGYDRNISTDVKPFRDLIEYYSSKYEVGLHPSWQSGDNPQLLREELEWLEVVADKPVKASRQHYIRFNTPDTFRLLINAGITDDFSMGYGTINGFRASVCSAYYWYDLGREEATKLVMHPYCFMDANSFFEQKQNPEQTYKELIQYYELVKKLNGTITLIWHNHMIGSVPEFKGWPEMFELFMRETVYWDAYSDSTLAGPGRL